MKGIKNAGFILLSLNLFAAIFFAITWSEPILFIILGIMFLIQVWLIIKFYYLIYHPVKWMEEDLEKIDRGENSLNEFEKELSESSLLKEFETILKHYVALKICHNNAEIFNKQTELTALQSQINPHFLYNTLDTIRGQAMCDDNIEVTNMIETLASFFRYSISRKGNLVTLRDELNNINNYMRIQQYRFNNRFSLEIVVDEEDMQAYDFYVPRLILQPIVENAIVHGLEEKTENARVIIEVTVADDLIITVSDNGTGMSIEELDLLNSRIHSSQMHVEEESSQNHSTGIALPNINKRIRLLFGDKYGLNVYSSSGCGTDVEVILPVDCRTEEMPVEKNSIKNERAKSSE